MQLNDSSDRSLISLTAPRPMINISQVLNIAQQYCFDFDPSTNGIRPNCLKKSLHHPEFISNKATSAQKFECKTQLHPDFDNYTAKAIPTISKYVSWSKSLKCFKSTIEFFEQNLVDIFRGLKHNFSLVSLKIIMTIKQVNINDEFIVMIAECIKRNPYLQSLSLDLPKSAYTTGEGIRAITSSFKYLKTLKTFQMEVLMSFCFTNEYFERFLRSFSYFTSLKHFDLILEGNDSEWPVDETLIIATVISEMRDLESFKYADGYPHSDTSNIELFKALGHKKNLRTLTLSLRSSISEDMFIEFAETLNKLDKLVTLSFYINNLNEVDGFEVLAKPLSRLSHLKNFEFNNDCYAYVENNFLPNFADAFSSLCGLVVLDFSIFGENNFEEFFKTFDRLTSLEILKLKFNERFDYDKNIKALEVLGESFSKLKSLNSLYLTLYESESLNDEAAIRILDLYRNIQNLKTFFLSFHFAIDLTRVTLEKFVEVSKHLVNLESFTWMFDDHNFEDDDLKLFAQGIQNFVQIREISIYFSWETILNEESIQSIILSMKDLNDIEKIMLSIGLSKPSTDSTFILFDEVFKNKSKLKEVYLDFQTSQLLPMVEKKRIQYSFLHLKKNFEFDSR